jgi:Domain of unknown function (DUF1707)
VAFAADAQRERALVSLRHHYLQGRLDVDELSVRTDRAVRARTTGDLRAALRDLPRLSETLDRARATAGLVGYLAVLGAVWCTVSVFLLLTLSVLALAGAEGGELLVLPGFWLVLSAAVLLAGTRRVRRR